jgi:predicted nucleic acid-binding Zn ribbon protein
MSKIFPTNTDGAVLHTTNPHAERLKDFNNTRLFRRLEKKHEPKPYWKQFQRVYWAVFGVSFALNVLSALTAAALVYFFVLGLTGSTTASSIITGTLLLALETMKRETSAKLFHGWLQFKSASAGMVAAVIALSAISTAASYFGASETVEQFTPPPETIDVAVSTGPIEDQIAAIDQQILAQQKNTWNGVMTPRAQKVTDRLTASREKLTEELVRARERNDQMNDEITSEHDVTMTANAGAFALFTGVCEVALIFCLFYIQYYDYRSYAEYALASGGATDEKPGGAPQIEYNQPGHMGYNAASGARARGIGFRYAGSGGSETGSETGNVTQSVTDPAGNEVTHPDRRHCIFCGQSYQYGHRKQKFCSDVCRVSAWKQRTGREVFKSS